MELLRLGVAVALSVGDLVVADICEVSRFFDRDKEAIPEIRMRYAAGIRRQFYSLVRCVKRS